MSDPQIPIPQFDVVFGRNLVAEIPNFVASPYLVVTMDDLWPHFQSHFPDDTAVHLVATLERQVLEQLLPAIRSYRAIVGLGGGQAVDCAKYFSWRCRVPLFQCPTSLSVDAVFGHRAGIREHGLVRYLGWAVPESVYIDYDVIESAPVSINRAGIGDVLCFITGIMDWQYARDRGRCESKWPYDETLAAVSLSRVQAALDALDDIRDMTAAGIDVMVAALRWGGASYHGSGWNPRHIEGVEHYVFYALEAATGQKFLHGQAVCLGLLAGCMMHGQRFHEMLTAIHHVGVDVRPESMKISWTQIDEALISLREFVERANLPYGIAHDFVVDSAFCSALRAEIEQTYGVWKP